MRARAAYTVAFLLLLCSLALQSALAAPNIKHQHNGRSHSHALPKTGVKHYHKHMHNGRAHIHPYSAKVGFKHTHNKSPRAKAWANAVKHNHGGRPHSHPLPRSGYKHNHKHKHGGRSHIHPLPASGAKHYHQANKRTSDKRNVINTTAPRMITGLSIKQQMAAVLGKPYRNIQNIQIPKTQTKPIKIKSVARPKANKTRAKSANPNKTKAVVAKTKTPILNSRTINKVLGNHRHDGRGHQHPLLNPGTVHAHKHIHADKVHSHLIPPSKTAHKHKSGAIAKQVKPKRTLVKKAALAKRSIAKQNNQRNIKYKAVTKTTSPKSRIVKPLKTNKQTPKQITEGNRQFNLALRYENGTGVKKNLPQAVNWYLRAAKNGNSKAQFNLASLYENGEGTKQNIPQAIRWYTTAAQNGDANAQVNLGNRYAEGRNVPKDINEAAKWYKRAADQGNVRGQANLNYLIEDYNGVIKR